MDIKVVWHCLLFGMQYICSMRIKRTHIITVRNIKKHEDIKWCAFRNAQN